VELGAPATVGGEGRGAEVDAEGLGLTIVLGVLGGFGLLGAVLIRGSCTATNVGGAGGATESDVEHSLLGGGVRVEKNSVNGMLAEGIEYGVLVLAVVLEAYGLEERAERSVANGIMALEGATGRAGEKIIFFILKEQIGGGVFFSSGGWGVVPSHR
jgi:hypothetical protein